MVWAWGQFKKEQAVFERVAFSNLEGIYIAKCGIRRLEIVHRVSSRLLGPVHPSIRALSGRLKYTVRRYKIDEH